MSEQRRTPDRTTVTSIVAGVLLVVMYAAAVMLSQRFYVVSAPAGSSFSSAPDGVKVYFAYLDKLGATPRTLQDFDKLPGGATIIAVGPFQSPPTTSDSDALASWVRRGGRLVVAGEGAQEILVQFGLGGGTVDGDASATVMPGLPGPYAADVRGVLAGPTRVSPDDASWAAPYSDRYGDVLLVRAVGAGTVLWLADAHPLTNAGIGQSDNGRLAALLAQAGSRSPIYFDEYHHGFVERAGAWERLGPGGRSATVLLGLALLVAMVAWARRIGPPIPASYESPARGGAYIGSLAELYRKAGARAYALTVLEGGLSRSLARTHGTIDAGLARHPDAAAALAASAALRERDKVPLDAFMTAARALRRARQEVEGHG